MTGEEKLVQYKRLENIVSRLTYKPGYSFSLEPFQGDEHVMVFLTSEVTSSVPPHDKFKIQYHMTSWYNHIALLSDKRVVDSLYGMVRDLELHELDEWFRVDDKHLHNPHPNQKEELWKA